MQKLYAPLCAHANAQCEFTTKGERFYGIGRAEFLLDKQIFLPPYAVKPLSFCGKLALCRSVCTQWCIRFLMVSTLRNMLNINGFYVFSAECRQFGKKINVGVCTEVFVCTMHFFPLQKIKIHALLCYRTYIG